MSDETYFVGTCFDSVEPGAGSPGGASDNASTIFMNGVGSPFVDCFLVSASTGLRAGVATPFWFHAVLGSPGSAYSAGLVLIAFFNAAGTEVLRLTGESGGTGGLIWQYWNGASWSTVPGTTFSGGDSGTLDVYCKPNHATLGELRLYWNNSLINTAAGLNLSNVSDVAKIRLYRFRAFNADGTYQSLICANYNTLGHTVRRRTPTGNGNYTAWTGAFGDVDDAALNDTDVINSSVVGDKESFTAAALSATAGGAVIKAVAIGVRLKNDGGAAPQNVRPFLRFGSTDYAAKTNLDINTGYRGGVSIYDVDPSTSAAWASITNPNGEFGVEART